MTKERWQDIVAHIKDNFEVLNHQTNDLPQEQGPGSIEVLEFQGPLGRMKLEFTSQPLILDKKTIGSRRIGSEVKVTYTYSDTEEVHRFKAFKYDASNDEWTEMVMDKGDSLVF